MKFPRILLIIVLIFLICGLCLPARAAENSAQVVLWSPEIGTAVSSESVRGNLAGTPVTREDDGLVGFSDADIWTVEELEEGWRFLQSGRALSMSASGSKLVLGAECDCWLLEPAEDGQYRIKNAARGKYLAWNSSLRIWSVGSTGTAVELYYLPGEEVEPEPPSAEGYTLYFGQLHAHTDLSDGTGTVEEAFQYASEVPGLDFFAVTDHSQSFDNADSASLTADAAQISRDWARGKAAAAEVTDGDFVGIFGFEMTWNQGQGHMSTFNTPGFLSREQAAYQSYATGMEAYYAALLEAEGSVSQFNHPGDADGDFKDFSGYSPALDRRITLIEVGGGRSCYDRALTLGWHLAPTNNQNNHAGHWGDETGARTVVLADALTEASLYEAMAEYRVYATEDADLEIVYTLNDSLMGTRIPLEEVGDTVTIAADLWDPTDPVGAVAVITEGGTVLAEDAVSGSRGSISFTLPADRPYYYLRITQADGDVAVTAPVWLDPRSDLGISDLKTGTEMTTAGAEQTLQLELFNDESLPWAITSITCTAEGKIYEAALPAPLAPYSTASVTVSHTFPLDGIFTVTAEVTGEFSGQTRRYSRDLQVVVMPKPLVDDVIIDGTHGTGQSFEKAMALAKAGDVDMILETGKITREMLASCRILILPAPGEDFEEAFVAEVKDYVNQGGGLILLGSSLAENPEAAARLNGLLEALGLSLRANADEVTDAVNNTGVLSSLYTAFFAESPWLEGVTEGQHYVQHSGCSVTGGSWLVKAMDGKTVLLAAEETGKGGWVFLSGGAFLEDVHMGDPEDCWTLPTANQTILETILDVSHGKQAILSLASLRAAEQGRVYLAQGRVTAGTANPNTTFENTIYIQDDTGAIAASSYSVHGLALGTRVRVLGSLESEEGNPTLHILRLEVLGKGELVIPAEVVPVYETLGGQLVKFRGRVVSAETWADGLGVSRFQLEDAAGNRTTVLVEENIRSGSRGKNELARIVKPGNTVSAVGLVHLEDGETVLRLRDCDEVALLWSPDWENTAPDGDGDPEDGEHPGGDGGDPDGGGDDSGGDDETPDGDEPGHDSEDDGSDGSDGEPDINPDTGDRSGIVWYTLLALLSLLGLALLHRKT